MKTLMLLIGMTASVPPCAVFSQTLQTGQYGMAAVSFTVMGVIAYIVASYQTGESP